MDESDSDMNPKPQREEALFQAAVQLTGPERAAFLDSACRGDSALRARLEALLAAHDQPAGVFAEGASPFGVPPSGGPAAPPAKAGTPNDPAAKTTMKLEISEAPDEAVGQTLGRYKLMERLGEGGCGVVYVAEQTQPVRRRVALKVIKLGMDTKAVVARFEAERQALAMMDHPNIAKVLDAGTTDVGRPYFVMELVRGIKHHRVLRPEQFEHEGAARSVHQGLPGHPARASERHHPSRHQAVEHPRDAARRRAGAQGD